MRVLLATGLESLDEHLKVNLEGQGMEVVVCPYREALMKEAQEKNADAVVLSPALSGEGDFIAGLIFPLRRQDIRIILLPGRIDEYDVRVLVARAIHYGVFDVIYDPVNAKKILERLYNPASYAKASEGIEIDLLQRQEEWLEKLEASPLETKIDEEGMEKTDKDEKDGKTGEKKKGRDSPRIRLPKIPGLKLREPRVRAGDDLGISGIICTVWSPANIWVSFVALNLAVATRKGYDWDVALLNFNVACPETDYWFGVRQGMKDCRKEDAGLMTFADTMTPQLALRMLELKRNWDVKYLPAGNKLINIGTPDFGSGEDNGVMLLDEVIKAAAGRKARKKKVTIIEAGSWFEQPPSYAALKGCDIMVIPVSGSLQEVAVLKQQLEELRRVEVEPKEVVEILFACDGIREPPAIRRRITLPLDMEGYMKASAMKKPYCLLDETRKKLWLDVVKMLFG